MTSRPAPDFIGVYGWLEERGSVLLVATRRDLGAAGRVVCWELPGGKVEAGELHEDAIRREMREETGLDVEVKRPLFSFYGERFSGRQRRYGWRGYFFELARSGGDVKPDDSETIAAKFEPVHALPRLFTAPYHQPVLRWLASGRTLDDDYLHWDDRA